MLVWKRRRAVRPFIAFAVTVALILSAIGIAFSHHASVAITDSAHHASIGAGADHHHDGHSHDEDEEDGDKNPQKPAHKHAHNAADHSHVTASIPPAPTSMFFAFGHDWRGDPPSFGVIKPHFQLDRPPKPIFFA
ncbi:hypothetical protein [Ferrovibrio sp.]|uniref:hypothetical protein n=1 Tax=Ferrovibrio sp. TaxID=1917215 RepID=UPI001B71F7C6|nr:hypothetical protein [Ferrovibrio sp.]MBP7065176.1 hypothetical protein [Ferrovibrio sp.]